jgi:ribokinase
MSIAKTVVVVGSINADLVVCAERIPPPGETVLGRDLQQFSGGKGANQAVACARMGASVRMIGCVGNDPFGRFLLEALGSDGVDTTYVRSVADKPSGVALITVDKDGQNAIVVSPGANSLVNADFVFQCQAAFEGASVLVLQLETPLDGVILAAKLAKERGIRVVLNPAPAQTLPKELLSLVDDVIPNQSELALLTGTSDVETGISVLQKMGPDRVVVTLGADGAVLADKSARKRFDAKKVRAVDTTAAGDSFVGAYVVAVAEGVDETKACQFGIAAGAICVTSAGAQASLPTRSAVEAML